MQMYLLEDNIDGSIGVGSFFAPEPPCSSSSSLSPWPSSSSAAGFFRAGASDFAFLDGEAGEAEAPEASPPVVSAPALTGGEGGRGRCARCAGKAYGTSTG